MNRKQRRNFGKKVGQMDITKLKNTLFGAILASSNSEWDKIFAISETVLEKVLFPKSIRELGSEKICVNPGRNFTESLDFALYIIEKCSFQIADYIKLENTYENYLFSCNYKEAKKTISKIEDKVGISLWSCGQKLILAEQEKGLEGNKRLLSQYLEVASKNRVLSALLEFFSYRAEEGTSLNNYNEKVDKFLKNFEEDEITFHYFSYKLQLQKIDFEDDMKYIFQIDCQFSAIDMYNSFIEVLQRAFANGIKVNELIWDRIKRVSFLIDDFRMNNLLVFKGENVHPFLKKNVLRCLELYTLRQYEATIEELSKYLEQNYNDFQMWIIYIKCHILSRKKFENKNEVIRELYSVYSLSEDCMKAKARLMFGLKKYSDTTWHYKLRSIISRKLIYSNINKEEIILSLLNEHTITPKLISLMPCENLKNTIFNGISTLIPETLRTLAFNGNYGEEVQECFRDKLYRADYLRNKGNYEEALKYLDSIECEQLGDILYIEEKILRLRYVILYEAGKYEEAMCIIVNAYFENKNLIKRCDLKFLYLKLKKSHNKKIYSQIEYPIFVYLYDELDTKKHRIAFSNFLDAQSIFNSDELIDKISTESKSLFFFEKICTLNVLKREVRLSKSAYEASKIRLSILQKLIEVNPDHQKEYLNEKSAITTKTEINNRIRQVSQRKVYVDEEKIKLEKRDIFMENFQKYLLLKSFSTDIEGFDVTDKRNIDSITKVLNRIEESKKNSRLYSQRVLALKDLISDIMYEFLRNEHYGLDTYLSSRIRHGYCKSQLTKELREHHLMLAASDDESPTYDVSPYWDAKIELGQEADYCRLKEMLSDFTHDIENKIQEIRKEWIRIKISDDEVGMFDFTTFVRYMQVVDSDNIIDFDVMYSRITSELWGYTNRCLEFIRKRVLMELREFYYRELSDLEKKIRELENSSIKNIIQELNGNITLCRAKISNIVTEFANIFYKDDILYEDYNLEDLATTCIGIEKQIHAGFEDTNIEQYIYGEKKLSGSSFSYFVEIIIMLLNNAVTHAGFQNLSEVQLHLQICMNKEDPSVIEIIDRLKNDKRNWSEENLLVIIVTNNLAPDKDVDDIRLNVESTFKLADDPQMLKQYSMTEGRSGLFKIIKTINYNMSVPYVEFYSVEENEFSLTLAVDATELLVQEEQNEDIICRG